MKKNLLIGLGIGIVVVSVILIFLMVLNGGIPNANVAADKTALQSSERSQVMGGQTSYEISLNTSMPHVPEKLLVYKTINLDNPREAITEYAKKFGFTGKINEGDNYISIPSAEGGSSVTLSKISGSAEFHNETLATIDRPLDLPENLPTDEQAIRIATGFLKEKDRYPPGINLSGINYQMHTGPDSKGKLVSRRESVIVWFDRTLNGLNVEGTIITVTIVGQPGEVSEYYGRWRNYEPYKELPLKSPEQALDELRKTGVSAGVRSPGNVSIDQVYLAYHTKTGLEHEDYLEPVYMFKGHADSGHIEEWVPALKEVPVELITSS
jgi:hypothetical protein